MNTKRELYKYRTDTLREMMKTCYFDNWQTVKISLPNSNIKTINLDIDDIEILIKHYEKKTNNCQ